jgi:hypothetical protein
MQVINMSIPRFPGFSADGGELGKIQISPSLPRQNVPRAGSPFFSPGG